MRWFFVCWLVSIGSLHAAEMRTHRDLFYAKTKNKRQTLDVYAPAKGKGHPIVVWIHGGGWQAGDKANVQKKPQAFVDRGFVFVSTNYRLLPEVSIKQMARDVAKAIHWVHDHAGKYGGDPKTIFIMGHSAGAHLAALVCTDHRYLKAEGLSLGIVKGCVPIDNATYDVPLQIATVEKRLAVIFRRKFGDSKSQTDLSPVAHVAGKKNIPPFLILHTALHRERKMQSHRLAAVLRKAGITADVISARGKTHRTLNTELGLPNDKPTKAVFAFVDRQLKNRGSDLGLRE
jgi:arylformamidase